MLVQTILGFPTKLKEASVFPPKTTPYSFLRALKQLFQLVDCHGNLSNKHKAYFLSFVSIALFTIERHYEDAGGSGMVQEEGEEG